MLERTSLDDWSSRFSLSIITHRAAELRFAQLYRPFDLLRLFNKDRIIYRDLTNLYNLGLPTLRLSSAVIMTKGWNAIPIVR